MAGSCAGSRRSTTRSSSAGHPQPTILPLDLATAGSDDYGSIAAAIRAQLGRLDGVVHAANVLGSLGPIEHQAFDAWLKVLRVDLVAAMALTRALMPLLAAAPDAGVVFTLDSRGQAPRAYWGAYAAAKAGLAALAAILADEWENRATLRVNAVVPGPINSPLRAQTHPGEVRSALPDPAALVPLYLYLLAATAKGGQRRADRRGGMAAGSGRVDATRRRARRRPHGCSAASPAGGGSRRRREHPAG